MTWISVKDKLPEPKTKVLIFNPPAAIMLAYYVYAEYIGWVECGVTPSYPKATHWQPLPEPPE